MHAASQACSEEPCTVSWLGAGTHRRFVARPSEPLPPVLPVSQAFLMTSAIAACDCHVLGSVSGDGLKWAPRDLQRPRGLLGAERQRLSLSRQKRSKDNTSCSQGFERKSQDRQYCIPCQEGYYQPYVDVDQRCRPCTLCVGYQVVKEKCTKERDAVCGCKTDHFKEKNFYDSDFDCRPCRNCSAQHKRTEKNCSEEEDARCGACLPGYVDEGGTCKPKPEPTTTTKPTTGNPDIQACGAESCKPEDPPNKDSLFLVLLGPLLVGLLLLSCKWRRIRWPSAAAGKPPHACPPPPLPRAILPLDPLRHSSAPQGRQLYAIIDVVPVRRWKEFVRGLGLRDGEIEAVEVEHGQLREQQYEMLKRWRQRPGATMDAVFAVLEEMQLGGCAQELRESVPPNP
ncbi:tumor necrosis factor receptor superfamily member 25 [Hemicordylus capensis]|uniref:tumor necrosis factor receptor superfamily member 25 n=1 Tax=Hemicordylus capensis TaxID=884348 RepID=UPI002303C686|nr:tumor necrosis factor receptor superfamily member 25 [Hemicordylus capensis]